MKAAPEFNIEWPEFYVVRSGLGFLIGRDKWGNKPSMQFPTRLMARKFAKKRTKVKFEIVEAIPLGEAST